MSKTLYIVRHAKASPDAENIKDWERPLIQAGIERANKISKVLKKKKICPDKMISSHAFRALNTAIIFAGSLNYTVNKIEISYEVYAKKPSHILDLIMKQDDVISSLMIFGHNPEFTDLYNLLTGEKFENLPTSSVACIHFDVEKWSKIRAKKGLPVFLESEK